MENTKNKAMEEKNEVTEIYCIMISDFEQGTRYPHNTAYKTKTEAEEALKELSEEKYPEFYLSINTLFINN